MKGLLLLLLIPNVIFAQFENDYFIIKGQLGYPHDTNLLDFNIESNTLNNEYNLFSNWRNDSITAFRDGLLLTYLPSGNELFLVKKHNYNLIDPRFDFFLFGTNPPEAECSIYGKIGTLYMFDDEFEYYSDNILGIVGKGGQKFYALNHLNYIPLSDPEFSTVRLVSFEVDEFGETYSNWTIIKDISDKIATTGSTHDPDYGLAFNPDSDTLYFFGINDAEEETIYSYNINTDELEDLEVDLQPYLTPNDYPSFVALHFMRGQNKIMMVKYETGEIYAYDLVHDAIELMADTELQYITGIVSKSDFMSNYEVENKGEVTIYPNPVKDVLYFKTQQKIESIELYDIVGQKIKQIDPKSLSIDLKTEPNGIYIVKIKLINGKTEIKKVIKQ